MTDRDLPNLPQGWIWTPLGDLADVKLGKMLSPKAFAPGLHQLAYLRNENVRWFSIDTSDVKSMGFTEDEREKFRLGVGDLLVCEGGEPGRCAVVRGERSSNRLHFSVPEPSPPGGKDRGGTGGTLSHGQLADHKRDLRLSRPLPWPACQRPSWVWIGCELNPM